MAESSSKSRLTVYPKWTYYPSSTQPPDWAYSFISVVTDARTAIDSAIVDGLNSDHVLSQLTGGLVALGYEVELGKTANKKIRRPVLFGENGNPKVSYEVDAVHDDLGVVVEVEAGRGARGNAIYRDLIRTSLIHGARFLVLGVMLEYRHQNSGKVNKVASYEEARNQLDAIYASGRLNLPFEGVLLFGY